MNKKNLCLSALALSLSLAASPMAFAHHEKCFDGERIHEMVHKLDLTSEQKTKIKEIMKETMDALKPKLEALYDVHMKINEAFLDNKMDDSKIDEAANAEKDILGSIIKTRLMERKEIVAELTDEQKKKLAEKMKHMEEKMHEHKMKEHKDHHGE